MDKQVVFKEGVRRMVLFISNMITWIAEWPNQFENFQVVIFDHFIGCFILAEELFAYSEWINFDLSHFKVFKINCKKYNTCIW